LFYDVHIFCCVHQRPVGHNRGCCAEKGALQLSDAMCRRTMAQGWSRVRINRAGCLNMCEYGPTMVIYPDGVWYRYSCMEDITEILQSHLRNGKRVERLLLDPDKITLKH